MIPQQNRKKVLALFACSFFVLFFPAAASDSLGENFTSQVASTLGSNNSLISVNNALSYYNLGDNTTIIGNYFTGYYYDSILGYFETNWSSNTVENVRVVSSTSACSTGLGYKLGGYAYSEYFGFIDFDYDATTFVYYCLSDGLLHGYGYNADLGFQSFEGISFEIEADVETVAETPSENDDFVNDGNTVTNPGNPSNPGWTPPTEGTEDSNYTPNSIQNNIIDFDITEESLFYIIK